jgi:hypothetical protein
MKIGHIGIKVQQYADDRWGFDDYSSGQRIKVRLWSKEKAEQRSRDICVSLTNSRGELLPIKVEELTQFREWKSVPKKSAKKVPK